VRYQPTLNKPRLALGGLTPGVVSRWTPILAVWGAATVGGIILFGSPMCVMGARG